MKVAAFEYDTGDSKVVAILRAVEPNTLKGEMKEKYPDADYIVVDEKSLPDRSKRDKWVIKDGTVKVSK
jgi:hypothetical protein